MIDLAAARAAAERVRAEYDAAFYQDNYGPQGLANVGFWRVANEAAAANAYTLARAVLALAPLAEAVLAWPHGYTSNGHENVPADWVSCGVCGEWLAYGEEPGPGHAPDCPVPTIEAARVALEP